ncbi:MAG: HAD family hydrolase [Roseivirga sp.]
MTYKTLILDFDGTIADTRKSILETIKFVAGSFRIKVIDEALAESLIGLPLKTTFEQVLSLDEKSIEEATLLYRKHYNAIAIDTISLFPDVKDTLSDLHQKGAHLTIASSKGRESLVRILEKHKIRDLFTFVGGEEDAKNKKPAPDIVNLIVERHHYQPNECLVVGDTVFDIEMGQRAGVDTCGVSYGNNSREALTKQNPDYIIDSFGELSEIVLI